MVVVASTTTKRSPGRQDRPGLIARDTLRAALQTAAEQHRVTVVTAAAGSGKTSLLRIWAHRPGRFRPVFVEVQRDRVDAQLFWLSLLGAIRRLSDAEAGAAPAATPDFDEPAAADHVLAQLSGLGIPVMLVLDDVHELAYPDTLRHLGRLLAQLPADVHAIATTRRDLPLGLHRLRLAGELAEIRDSDLRFSRQEACELLSASAIAVSAEALAQLHRRTEGWAAGLRLAAIAMAGHPSPEGFVAEFTGSSRTVADYLIAEMLDRLPLDVRSILLRTSILRRVNGELADLLAGRRGCEPILLDLEDANAFVVSLDPARTWFRYHHLFGDLLQWELRRTLPDEVRPLHRQAAGWLTEDGQVAEAVRHLQAAGDWTEAAALLCDHAFGMMLDGQEESAHALLKAFPRRGTDDYPELDVVRAMVDLVHGRLDEAAAHVAVAESREPALPTERRRRLGMAIAALRFSLAKRRGDLAAVLEHSEFLARPIGGQSGEEIALQRDLRVVALLNLGTIEAFNLGLSDGERHLREGLDLAREIGRPYLQVACLAQLGFASKLPSFSRSRQICEEAIALADAQGWGTAWIVAPALITLACTLVWTGEVDAAQLWLGRAAEALQADSGPGIRTLFHLVAGMLRAGRGDTRASLEEFARAQDIQARLTGPHALTGFVTGWTAATLARLGETTEARVSLAALTGPLASTGEIVNAHAVISLAEGNPAAALSVISDVVDGTTPVVHVATVVEAWLVSALAHRELGSSRHTVRALEHALALAESEALILPFLMTGAHGLLEAVPSHETAHASLVADILDAARSTASADPTRSAGVSTRLSPTELRILRYLPTNLSRPEIADALRLSTNTVSTHVRNIYAKLQATDRSAAVARARELRLLGGR